MLQILIVCFELQSYTIISNNSRCETKKNVMKHKNIIYIIVATLALMATGCKKDGIYRPSEKISGFLEYYERTHQRYDSEHKQWIVIQKDSVKRHQTEKWVWKGKLLDRIDFYSDNSVSNSFAFIYDGRRLASAYISATKSRIEYEYDGKRLKTMTVKDKNGKTTATCSFDYDDKKLSSITVDGTFTGQKSDVDVEALALMPILGDRQVAYDLSECHKKNAGKKSETVYTIAWKGDNIKSITNSSDGSVISYRYDDKTNPLQGLLPTFLGVGRGETYAFGNKNNVISVESGGTKLSYSYTYSVGLPVSRSRNEIDHYTQGYRYVKTYITYYEYVE